MRYNFDSISGGALVALILLYLILIGLWIWALVWASQKKGWIGFLAVFVANFWGWLIIFLIVNNDDKSKGKNNTHKREREKKFRCGLCYIEYQNDLLGAETVKEGKICRWCLEKKQQRENSA